MPVIDRDGRVFGRLNLVDALLVALVVLALPAAYAANRLFRDPPAHLTKVLPPAIEQGSTRLIEIQGDHLRPFMRVSFGDTQGARFDYYGPTQAFVPAPALEPGTYDVVLYDYTREVARLPKALVVSGPVRPPSVTLRVRGAYVGVTADTDALLTPGRGMDATDGMVATIEARDEARPAAARVRIAENTTVTVPMPGQLEVPATLRVVCLTSIGPGGVLRCATGGVALVPDMHISFQGPSGLVLFRIDRVEGIDTAGKEP